MTTASPYHITNILDTGNLPPNVQRKQFVSKRTALEYTMYTLNTQNSENNEPDLEANRPETNTEEDIQSIKYRSVIADPITNRLLCVAPWTAITSSDYVSNGFTINHLLDHNAADEGTPYYPVNWWKLLCHQMSDTYSADGNEDYGVETEPKTRFILDEMIEGTMINLFYDDSLDRWELATRKNVGADCWFYRTHYFHSDSTQKTFRQMFLDAFPKHYLSNDDTETDINDIPLIRDLPKHLCYSFVLQHPDNHIVYPIHSPALYLVGAFEIIHRTPEGSECVFDTNTQQWNFPPRARYINTHSNTLKDIFQLWFNEYILYLPNVWENKRVQEALNTIEKWSEIDKVDIRNIHYSHFSYRVQWLMGFAFTDIHTGLRFTVDNPYYTALKELRGNNPNLMYHFLELNREGKVDVFLDLYPQYNSLFYDFQGLLYGFIQSVYVGYVEYYVKQIKTPIEKRYFIHIAKLHHEVFLPSVQTPPRKPITFRVVQEYVYQMEPKKLYYYLTSVPSSE